MACIRNARSIHLAELGTANVQDLQCVSPVGYFVHVTDLYAARELLVDRMTVSGRKASRGAELEHADWRFQLDVAEELKVPGLLLRLHVEHGS